MADLIESCRIAMRRRIFSAGIATQSTYQKDGYDAPKAKCYIRETVIENAREELMQSAYAVFVLCEYDIFVDRGTYANVTAKASEIAAKFMTEFTPFSNAKCAVTLANWTGTDAQIYQVPQQGTAQFERESNLYKLPIIIYVQIVADKDAQEVTQNGNDD